MKKWLKRAGLLLLLLFIAAQFVRPARTNPPVDSSLTIRAHAQLTPQAAAVLERSCRDCHSSATRWPWYSNVAPFSWWLINHVNHGRSHFNLSEWSKIKPNDVDDILEEMCEEVESRAMPLPSYLWIHWDARLSEEERRAVCEWTEAERQRLARPAAAPATPTAPRPEP